MSGSIYQLGNSVPETVTINGNGIDIVGGEGGGDVVNLLGNNDGLPV